MQSRWLKNLMEKSQPETKCAGVHVPATLKEFLLLPVSEIPGLSGFWVRSHVRSDIAFSRTVLVNRYSTPQCAVESSRKSHISVFFRGSAEAFFLSSFVLRENAIYIYIYIAGKSVERQVWLLGLV